jgi:putative PIN family toxin of toxin-antitoxin system
MLRVVIDTNSLVSYVLTRGDIMRRVIAAWRANDFILLSSAQTRAELAAVVARPKIKNLSVAPLDELVKGIERLTTPVYGEVDLSGACRDPKDDKFIACAVAGEADYLVSSDRDLLDMERYQDVAILNPGQFLLALALSTMEPKEMVQRFEHDTLKGIAETISLEPKTASRLEAALV